MTSSTSITGSKVGRAHRRLSQLWQVPTFLLGLVAFFAVAASAPWRHTPQEREFTELIKTLRHNLDHEPHDTDDLVAQAENALLRLRSFPARAAEVHFLAGSAYYRQAQQKPPAYARELSPRAAELFEIALARGVAESDRLPLQYRLGFALHQQSKELPRALELMTAAVDKGAEHPLLAYQLLLQANLQLAPPNLDGALTASRRILDLTPERETDAVAQARLQHGELLVRKELRGDALKELERIGPKAPREIRLKARQLQARCCEDDNLWSRAIPIWQELLREAPYVEGGRARIYYSLGWCNYRIEPPNYEETKRVWAEALSLGGPEGQAAGLRLGELRLALNDGKEASQALADWKQALAKVNAPADFKNPYLSLNQVRTLFDQAMKQFQEMRDPHKTQEIAALYRKVAPAGTAELKLAQAEEALAEQMRDKPGVSAEEVQAQFRRAGEEYEQAAKVRPDAERPESLWRSGQCFLSAKETARAQKIFLQYVRIETKEARLAEAWNTLGDLYRIQSDKQNAHDAYTKCIEYPNTPFAYRARYWLAVEKIDQKDYEKGRDILKQILDGDQINIDRPAQEKALYKMASLLMQMKDYSQAHFYLGESLRLYPENQNGPLAREQLGECLRRLAEKELAKEIEVEKQIIDTREPEDKARKEETRRHHHQTRMHWLSDALKTYEGLSDELKRMSQQKPLTKIEQILVRRALFGIGECHLDTGNLEEALRIYQKLQLQHRRSLEACFAATRICHMAAIIQPSRLADQTKDVARESVRLLLEDLNAMPKDHELFMGRDAKTREGWLRDAEATRLTLFAAPKTGAPRPAFP